MTDLRRRAVLTTVSTGAISSIAGCSDLLGQDETNGGDETDGTNGSNEKPTAPETIEEAGTLLVEDFANGRFERASERFVSTQHGGSVDPGRLEKLWMGLTAVGGEYDEIAATNETVVSGYDAVDVTLGFERSDHELRVVVDDELQVRSITFQDEYEQPAYVDPDAVAETGVTLETDACRLAGIATTPADATDDVPGVVLVHGSGPVNKNAAVGGTRLFQDIAEGFAKRGIATLRYDKRTFACPRQMDEHTLETGTVEDALLAVEKLRSVDGVDPDRIVVIGHSLGGMAAPRIAARDGGLAGAVGLAAPSRSFYEVTLDQMEYLATLGDYQWDQMQTRYEDWSDRVDRIRNGEYNPSDSILGYSGAFWQSLDGYDQVETARKLDVPLLFCQGTRDFRVSLEDDFERWQAELEGRSATEFKRYDGLNHLFMPGDGPSVQFEYALRNNFEERVLADLADWIDGL